MRSRATGSIIISCSQIRGRSGNMRTADRQRAVVRTRSVRHPHKAVDGLHHLTLIDHVIPVPRTTRSVTRVNCLRASSNMFLDTR